MFLEYVDGSDMFFNMNPGVIWLIWHGSAMMYRKCELVDLIL